MSTRSLKLEALADMIERDGADPKPTMLRVLTDFYVQKTLHTPEEDRHFTELALRLIGDVDSATRADIIRRLTEHGGAPAIVLRRLLDAGIANAETFRFGQPAPAAPTPPVEAPAATVPGRSAVSTNDRAAASDFSEMFFASESVQRRAMLRELDRGAVKLSAIAAHEAAAACRELEGAALRSRPFEFVREMERALGIPRAVAQKIVNEFFRRADAGCCQSPRHADRRGPTDHPSRQSRCRHVGAARVRSHRALSKHVRTIGAAAHCAVALCRPAGRSVWRGSARNGHAPRDCRCAAPAGEPGSRRADRNAISVRADRRASGGLRGPPPRLPRHRDRNGFPLQALFRYRHWTVQAL